MSGSYLCIPRNETVISKTESKYSVSQFRHSYICERFIYFQDQSACSAAGKCVDRSWEYINRSQAHECGNWDWGRAIPRKGIHKWDFPCSVASRDAANLSSEWLIANLPWKFAHTKKCTTLFQSLFFSTFGNFLTFCLYPLDWKKGICRYPS
jgi:hypothetical protein